MRRILGILKDSVCPWNALHGRYHVAYSVKRDRPFFMWENSWGQEHFTGETNCGINLVLAEILLYSKMDFWYTG